METQVSDLSEQQIAQRIIHLHENLGLGFRRIAKKLSAEDIPLSKDRAHRLYRKYRSPLPAEAEEASTDKELEALKRQERRAARKAKLAKEKFELRKRIADFKVKEAMYSSKTRTELFSDEKKLLKFLEKIMPVVDPSLWIAFKTYCATQGYNLANAAAIAIGEATDYDAHLTTSANQTQKLHSYFQERLRESLETWKQEEETKETSPEQTQTASSPTYEYVTIERDEDYP